MDNIDNNPPIIATRVDEPPMVVYDEQQSATTNLQHDRIPYIYAPNVTIHMHIPANMGPTTQRLSIADVTTPGLTLEGNQRFVISWKEWATGVGVYIAINGVLLAYATLKPHSGSDSTFETHLAFFIMAIAAFILALFTSGIVVYTKDDLESLMTEHYFPICNMILKCLLWFFAILSPLSLLLMIFLPKNSNLVGFLIVCALFVVILAFNLCSLKRKRPGSF